MSLIRSFMLVKPSPCPLIAFCRSKPTPESCTLNWISFDAALSNTLNCRAPLCLTAFWRASCKTRKRQSAVSGGSSWEYPGSENQSPHFAALKTLGKRRSEEHTSELQSRFDLVCRLLLE